MLNVKLLGSPLLATLVAASLTLGTTTPVFAGEFDDFTMERLRQAPGNEGVGFGGLVLPTYTEPGQLTANLYNASDRPVYQMAGHLSLFLPSTYLPVGRMQFGGFGGSIRKVTSDQSPHPSFVGFVEGTWTMDGQGRGDLRAFVYEVDGEGIWQPIGLITGEFDAVAIVIPDVGPRSNEGDVVRLDDYSAAAARRQSGIGGSENRIYLGPASSSTDSWLATLMQSLSSYELTADFRDQVEQARRQADLGGFGERPADLEIRIREARKQAAQQSSGTSDAQTSIAVQTQMAAHLMVKYKIMD